MRTQSFTIDDPRLGLIDAAIVTAESADPIKTGTRFLVSGAQVYRIHGRPGIEGPAVAAVAEEGMDLEKINNPRLRSAVLGAAWATPEIELEKIPSDPALRLSYNDRSGKQIRRGRKVSARMAAAFGF